MTELLTAAQMRAIEAAAIESGEVTGLELMERAGRGVVAAAAGLQGALVTASRVGMAVVSRAALTALHRRSATRGQNGYRRRAHQEPTWRRAWG